MKKFCLVTGAAGFIGSRVCQGLAQEGFQVIAVDDLSIGRSENVSPEIELVEGDISDPGIVAKLPVKLDYVLHLAGQSSGEDSFRDPENDAKRNYISTIAAARIALATGAKKIIHASSMSIYGLGGLHNTPFEESIVGNPISNYGTSKLAAEQFLALNTKLRSVSLRMFNVYGPGQDLSRLSQGMVSIYLAQALRDGRIVVKGSLDRVRDFVFIEDVVECWIKILEANTENHENINLGSGRPTKVSELLTAINSLVGRVPIEVANGTPGDQHYAVANNTKLIERIGSLSFTALPEGLSSYVKELRESFEPQERRS
jgi:UDP-glucose 4-epimerase